MRTLSTPFFLAVLSSCSWTDSGRPLRFTFRDIQQPAPLAALSANKVLGPSEIAADVDLLQYALDRGYGGRAFVPQASWQKMGDQLAALRGQSLTVDQLCDAIADALWEVTDAHLSATFTGTPNRRCGRSYIAKRRVPQVGKNVLANEAKRAWKAYFEFRTTKVALLAIKYLPVAGSSEWEGFDQAIEQLKSSREIVIDLRSNGGGDDARLFQLAQLLAGRPVQSRVWREHKRQTPESLTLFLNLLDHAGRENGVLPPDLAKLYADAEARRSAHERPGYAEYEVETQAASATVGSNAFEGQIAIIVDSACASSCESGLEVLRQHPRAKVFGERTAGYIHFGNVGKFWLKNSRVRIGIPTKYNEYPNGEFYDRIGFAPDVEVRSGDAIDEAMRWLSSQ